MEASRWLPAPRQAPGLGDSWPDKVVIFDYVLGYKFSLPPRLAPPALTYAPMLNQNERTVLE